MKLETGRGMILRYKLWQQDRFMDVLAPSMSIKARSLLAQLIRFEQY